MARISHDRQKTVRYLRGHHVFGRDPEYADITLHTAGCSRIHAVIEWTGQCWALKDLSKNGTWIDETPAPPNTPVGLKKGCSIRFGDPAADPWHLIDTGAPADLLIGENKGAKTLDLEDYMLLPDPESQYTLLFDHEQAGWLLYSPDEPREIGGPYGHGDEVVVNRQRWRVFLANAHSQTPIKPNGAVTPSQIHLVLRLSRDEENTQLTAIYGSSSHDLGDRAHHYLIAHLARIKSADIDEGLDLSSSGWIDKERLAKDLGLSANHLNLQIHRAQKHLCDELRIAPKEANRLFDRQRGRVRLGFVSCDVFKGDTLLTKLAS